MAAFRVTEFDRIEVEKANYITCDNHGLRVSVRACDCVGRRLTGPRPVRAIAYAE